MEGATSCVNGPVKRKKKQIQDTPEIKRTLFNWTKRTKCANFRRNPLFQQTQKNKQLIQFISCQLDVWTLAKEKRHETDWRYTEKGPKKTGCFRFWFRLDILHWQKTPQIHVPVSPLTKCPHPPPLSPPAPPPPSQSTWHFGFCKMAIFFRCSVQGRLSQGCFGSSRGVNGYTCVNLANDPRLTCFMFTEKRKYGPNELYLWLYIVSNWSCVPQKKVEISNKLNKSLNFFVHAYMYEMLSKCTLHVHACSFLN